MTSTSAPPAEVAATSAGRRTIGAALSARPNSLNAIRLVLAIVVIWAHTGPVGGFADRASEGLSGVAVAGFFTLSGYLIAGSRTSLPLGRYLWHRALRILPAYWVCLVVTAFVAAPVAAALRGNPWSLGPALDYVVSNLALKVEQYDVVGTLAGAPLPDVWNGSLWTLFFEGVAYVAAGLLLGVGFVRRRPAPYLLALVPLAAVAVLLAHGPAQVTTSMYLTFLLLGSYFAAGMALWSVRDRVPRSTALAAVSAVAVLVLFLTAGEVVSTVLMPVPLAYLLLHLGGSPRVPLGSRNDVSYGVYVYAFPVQQVLVALGAERLGWVPMFVLATAVTVPLAWVSWVLVERPALRLKHLGAGHAASAPS